MEQTVAAAKSDRDEARHAYLDLRSWLTRLDETGRLAIARPETDLRFMLAGIANRNDGDRATIFPHPSGHPGTVVSGLLSRRAWMAEALGISEDRLLERFQAAEQRPLAPVEVENAPCQEVVHEDDFDLADLLPIPVHNEHDSGAYITAGLLISANPKTGAQNVAIHRLQLSGPRELGALLLPRHTLAFNDAAEADGHDLPVAIVIGASPACLLASQAIVPIDFDELGIAGALCGAPLEVVRCKGSELRVPARSEIVVEGRLKANRRAPEGPFGEFPQYYGERDDRHVIEVDRVTTRSRPLFHTIVGGGLEHLLLGGIPREATILATMRRSHPGVVDVHLSRGGVCRYHLHVKLRRREAGEAKNVILAALAAHYDIKHVVVVDEDVDIHDPTEVEWAVATRFQADRDMVMIPGSQGSKLDPSTDNGLGCKTGFDATVPAKAPEFRFRRIRVPGEEAIDLDDVLDPAARLAEVLS
ncbi:UbiD family decarboxylase [Jiella sonneratiae]|uniref:UbiD family decarboxylase n=1 Tax=Jiella sonneratiae TaxID=2816856 RepID=UPI003159FE32